MQMFRVLGFLLLCACFAGSSRSSAAADDSVSGAASAPAKSSAPPGAPAPKSSSENHLDVGVGVKVSTLGIGGELALPVTHRSNVRFGFSVFNYNHTFMKDGVTYKGALDLRSAQAVFDIFSFTQGFHLSPGVLLYNGNKVNANASVPGGQSFTLNGTTYVSDAANPIAGTGKLTFYKAAPMFLVGFGNLVPRSDQIGRAHV